MTNILDSWNMRILFGEAIERARARELNELGWVTAQIGQGAWGDVTGLLRPSDPLRHWPDILAVRGPVRYLIDAKGGRTNTTNYDLQCTALEVAAQIDALFGNLLYVWPDRLVSRAADVVACSTKKFMKGKPGRTDYWLIPKSDIHQYEFDEIFGPLT